jgi:hypothetical protein
MFATYEVLAADYQELKDSAKLGTVHQLSKDREVTNFVVRIINLKLQPYKV